MKKINPYWKGKKFLKNKFIKHVNQRNPHIKIFLVAERKDGKQIRLPVSKYTIFELSDFCYYDGYEFEKVRDDLDQFFYDCEFLEHDVIDNGRWYGFNKKTKKFDTIDKHYLYRKPQWK